MIILRSKKNKRYPKGLSLVESLFALTLLGVLFIPLLFTSSAFFSNQLVATRGKLGVVHNASQFLNRFQSEMSMTRRILPSISNSTAIYFAYYDPVRQVTQKGGYRLSAATGTNLKLERMRYNDSTGTWSAITPYGIEPATSVELPAGTTFQYCTAVGSCSASPDDALFVRLSGWTFTKVNDSARKNLTLPDMNVYLASGIQGDMVISDTSRQLFSFLGTTAFGSGTDVRLTALSSNRQRLLNLNTSSVTSNPGTLSTIASGYSNPGAGAMIVDQSTGRLYFGEAAANKGFYTYLPTTGLSTILFGASHIGYEYEFGARIVSTEDGTGRVFFASENSTNSAGWVYTYAPSTGVTTLTSHSDGYNYYFNIQTTPSGRVYYSFPWQNNVWSWHSSTGLSTLFSSASWKFMHVFGIQPGTERVFFSEYGYPTSGSERYYTWMGGVLTTIVSGYCNPMHGAITREGRLYFKNCPGASPSENLYTWLGGVLTTIISNGNHITEPVLDYETGRAYFSNGRDTGSIFYSYHPSTGLSTILGSHKGVGLQGRREINDADEPKYVHSRSASRLGATIQIDSVSGRIYFGEQDRTKGIWDSDPTASSRFYTWQNNVLTTIVSGRKDPGYMSAAVDPKTGGVFFGEKGNPGNFYYFHSSTGLSTIVSGLKWPGVTSTIVDNDGRVYFSDFNWPNNVYSWSPSTGLSTIISNAQCAGCMEAIGIHRTTGRAYIGTYSSGSGHVYTFMPSSTTGTNASVRRASQTGEASNQPLNLAYNSGTYTGMTQDVNRAIYLLETSGKTVDRYTYDGGDSRYERQSQLAWTTWATTVGAIAIDSSTNGIALLDTGNKQIDIYADRTVNGTPAAPTSLSISGTTTPTGLAVSSRTGDYLVLDSALQSSTNVRLFVYSNTGTLKRTIAIDVTTANLSVSATGETDFKILYNDQDNILYLLSPSLGRVFGLSLPEYL